MFSPKQQLKKKLEEVNTKLTRDLDFDFSSVSKYIVTEDEFYNEIYLPFKTNKRLFYRGERINSSNRHLLPTMLRDQHILFDNNNLGITHFNADFVLSYYKSLGDFVDVFSNTMGVADKEHMYEICAFAQHYYHKSPLIDFTKSLYPSLSFALKDRSEFIDDIVLYVVEINNDSNYTNDISVADKWLSELDIYASYFDESNVKTAVKAMIESKLSMPHDEFRLMLEQLNTNPTPKAKLIDVTTNTRMKFQQGVFLLLTDFQLYNVTYLTKNMREEFNFTKYIISKDICPSLVNMIKDEAPWYSYDCLTDVEKAFKIATIS